MSATATTVSQAPAASGHGTQHTIKAVAPPSSETLPSNHAVAECAPLTVLDRHGDAHRFDSLYGQRNERTLIIFVRHFFCGMCQEFLTTLSASVSPESLSTPSKPASIVVIGCGDPSLIQEYAERTSCPFPIYTDSSCQLHQKLGLHTTMRLGEKPEYQYSSLFGIITKSLSQVLSSGVVKYLTKSGPSSQVGGEVLFEDGKLSWCHRMTSTRDHTSVPEIKSLLGLAM